MLTATTRHTATFDAVTVAAATYGKTGMARAAAYDRLASDLVTRIVASDLHTTDLLAAVSQYQWFRAEQAVAARS